MKLSIKWIHKGIDRKRCGLAIHIKIGHLPLVAFGLAAPPWSGLWFINRWRENSRQIRVGPFMGGYLK